jgi:hypothetical protein
VQENAEYSQLLSIELKSYTRYRGMYRSMRFMGASDIVRAYLGLEERIPLPFSLAHGVWPYGVKSAQNCSDIEPWHWSFNDIVHEAINNKASVLLPHPWLLLAKLYSDQVNSKIALTEDRPLLVGLPPSKTNDRILLGAIQDKNISPHSILIKPRGLGLEASMAFWLENGIQPLVAHSYQDLHAILIQHSSICCPSFSSIIFFAASIGLDIQLLRDVPMYAYESLPEAWNNDWIASQKTGWARVAALSASMSDIQKESLDTLGSCYMLSPDKLALKILEHVTRKVIPSFSPLRSISGRGALKSELHDFLAARGMSFPSLYITGFRRVIQNRILARVLNCSHEPLLGRIRFPSIDEELSGRSPQVISSHSPSRNIQAGFGASA